MVLSGCSFLHPTPPSVPPPPVVEYDIQVLMTPYQESPQIQSTGTGKFSLNTETWQYEVRIHGFDFDNKTPQPTPLIAYLQCAKPSANGPIVYKLTSAWKPAAYDTYTVNGILVDSEVIDSNSDSACSFWIRNMKDLQEALDAGELYVNLHSMEHPFGEIRGQIYKN